MDKRLSDTIPGRDEFGDDYGANYYKMERIAVIKGRLKYLLECEHESYIDLIGLVPLIERRQGAELVFL